MKKLICLAAVVSMLGLTACTIDSQGFYVTKEALEMQAQESARAVTGQGIIPERGSSTELYGCDTFTDILNMKYCFGSGYANAKLGGTDVLFLSDGIYDDHDGTGSAINSELYCYKDGKPAFLGYVRSGGTATPLAVKDGLLYACGHHYIGKITVRDGVLVTTEEAWETFDEKGNVRYHSSSIGGDETRITSSEAERVFNKLYDEYIEAEVVEFDIVKPGAYTEFMEEAADEAF
ncbi:MAG: hypothetical protein IKE56_09710 [Lachnospiraceae bacterium]|nr:hypothetical protein [Lachnospiraceae bacterium]